MKIKELKDTVVNVETYDEFKQILCIYQASGWRYSDGSRPKWLLNKSIYMELGNRCCFEIKNNFEVYNYNSIEGKLKIISFKEFKEIQNIKEVK
jgi:hypothetical protein